MNEEELKYRQFHVMRTIAYRRLDKQLIYCDTSYLESKIQGKKLQDAEVLLRMVKKLIAEYNSKINADRSRVENLRFQNKPQDFETKYFIGIPAERVLNAVSEYSGDDYYKIADQFESLL
jgi:hypothetical protein